MSRGGRWRGRALRGALWTAIAAFVLVGLSALYLRRDQTGVFLETRDRIAEGRVVESWSTGSSRVERLEFLDACDHPVSTVLLRLPESSAATRRTLVVYAGQHTGDRILDLVPERPGVVLIAPLYPRIDPHGALETLLWPHAVRGAVFATVAGGMAALARLDSTGVPRGTTAVLAASLGSSFGTIHAALDRRVDELVVIHGGGDLPFVLRRYYQNRGRPAAAVAAPALAWAFVDAFDPVRWIGRVAPRPVLLIASRRDKYFPAASVEALAGAAGDPKKVVWTDTDHVGASKTEIVASIVAEIESYLDGLDGGAPVGSGGS